MADTTNRTNGIYKFLEVVQFVLAALGVILVAFSSFGVLYFKSVSMLGVVAGLGLTGVWFLVAIPWVLMRRNKRKTWVFSLVILISALNFFFFNAWQYLGEYAFFMHKKAVLSKLSSMLDDNALDSAFHFRMEDDCLEINWKCVRFVGPHAVYQYEVRDSSAKDTFLKTTRSDTVDAGAVLKIAELMKACNTIDVRKSHSFLIIQIGGMLDTRYGFLKKREPGEITVEEQKQLDRYGHYLRKMSDPWYYYNTGA